MIFMFTFVKKNHNENIVDRSDRNKLAELIRHLISGTITTYTFFDSADDLTHKTEDETVKLIAEYMEDLFIDERNIKLRGRKKLSKETKIMMLRCCLLLYSNKHYEWPFIECPTNLKYTFFLIICDVCIFPIGCIALILNPFIGILFFASAIFIDRWVEKRKKVWEEDDYNNYVEAYRKYGDYEVWPFIRNSDFDEAKRHPPLLVG